MKPAPIDSVTLEIVHNALGSVVDEAFVALMKSAFSQNIKERRDHSTAFADRRGRLVAQAKEDILVGEEASAKLIHFPTTTREESPQMGRITTLIETGELFGKLGQSPLNHETDRVMICGSMGLNKDLKAILEARGFVEGANSKPGDYVVERAFVD